MLRATGVNQARHISSIVRTPASANTFRITKRAFSLDFKPEEMQEYTVDPLDETVSRTSYHIVTISSILWEISLLIGPISLIQVLLPSYCMES